MRARPSVAYPLLLAIGWRAMCPAKPQKRQRPQAFSSRAFTSKIGVTGFEPATLWTRTTRATKLRYTPGKLRGNYSSLSVGYAACRAQGGDISRGGEGVFLIFVRVVEGRNIS